MGLFNRKEIRKKELEEQQVQQYFDLMNAYSPVFSSFEGGVYEMELTRSAIHTFATHISMLKPEINGKNNEKFERKLQTLPNPHMNTSQYLYKLATIYMIDNTAFILPLYEDDFKTISGFYPVKPSQVKYLEYKGKNYFQFQFPSGQFTLESDKVGVLNQYLYDSDFFGRNNSVLKPTMELINANNQGIIEGIHNSAYIRFIAKLSMSLKPEDIEKERKRLVKSNLDSANNGGVMLVDQKYDSIQQVSSEQYTVSDKQMQQIKENVFNYFGVNEHILQNNYTTDEWSAYYEGKIEPFAIQLSLEHTNMCFTDTAQSFGNQILFTTNRLQHASMSDKINYVTQLLDRGVLSPNEAREVFNMSGYGEEGEKRFIRREYTEVSNVDLDRTDVSQGEENEQDNTTED